jgi:hypothetical protein
MTSRTTTHDRRPARGRRTLAGGVVVALVATLLALGMAQAEEASTARNVARNATASASFTASHNDLNAVNDGAHSNSGAPETSYWGTWTAVDRPASHYLQYNWVSPVTIDRSVVSFWTDAAPGTGANVTVPQSWEIEYWDDGSAAWAPVTSPSGYGTSRTGSNETTFDPVSTTRVRATFQAYPNAGGTSYSALGVSEWEVWGGIAAADPDAVIEVPAVQLRTTPGVVPALPGSLDVVRLGGRITPVEVSWATIPQESLVAGAEVPVAGDLAGLDDSATATIWVREAPSPVVARIDDASVITTEGVRPNLPKTVTATFDDGSRDSGVAVTWAPPDQADYADEGVFAVDGDVAGTEVGTTAWVFVEPADLTAPTPAFTLETSPAQATGRNSWFTGPVSVRVLSVDADQATYEANVDGAGWAEIPGDEIAVTGDGVHEVAVRESGAATSQVVTVAVDTSPPSSSASVSGGTVTVSAADATSGVERIDYRTDPAADWSSYTGPVQVPPGTTVNHRAVDAAGNVGQVGAASTIQAPGASEPPPAAGAPEATQVPRVSGTAMVGRTLQASPGVWNVEGVALSYQWWRDGTAIAGATYATYAVGQPDIGGGLAVQVTATAPGRPTGTARSAQTSPVVRAVTRTTVSMPVRVKVRARVSAVGVVPTGVVRIYDGRRLLKRVVLRDGTAVTRISVPVRGRHRIVVRYAGSASAAPSSGSVRLRVT